MKITVAEYIAEFLYKEGLTNVFSVVGGGAMYLNNAFGKHPNMKCLYHHHEQAATMAADGFARISNTPGIVCVTTGPGGTNAVTGVLAAYQESIPMLIISGQVRTDTTVESTGLHLRQYGEQECEIIKIVDSITKYSHMVKDANRIKYYLKKALYIAQSGRKGPCWLDIPLDVQGTTIETDFLEDFNPQENTGDNKLDTLIEAISTAERPVFAIGAGLHLSETEDCFIQIAEKMSIPIISALGVTDIVENSHPLYVGSFGVLACRAGNFVLQNADLIIVLGCNMSFKHTGFNVEKFAPDAKLVMVDIDAAEMQKPSIHVDIAICADLKEILPSLKEQESVWPINNQWLTYCKELKEKYPVYQESYKNSKEVNPYYFSHCLNKHLSNNCIRVIGNSVISACAWQLGTDHREQRILNSTNCGSMGWDIPAAIGAAYAGKQEVYCLTGDGSFQMNIQELATISFNNVPIKIIVANNGGYQAIVASTQNHFGVTTGATPETGLGFPELDKIAAAYDMKYIRIENHDELEEKIELLVSYDGPVLCEIIQDKGQFTDYRMLSKRLPNGKMQSPAIDDLSPFLSDDEYSAAQYQNWSALHN